MKIVIIGNGASLLDHQFGDQIDQFDEVVRFNDFRIKGYEKYVGTKTTIWARNTSKGDLLFEKDCQFKQVLVQHTRFQNEYYDLTVVARPNHIEMNPVKHDEICKYTGINNINTSTGIQTIAHFSDSGNEVYIAGFDCFHPPRKYFDADKDSRMPHSTTESIYINHLMKQNLIKMLGIKII